MNNSMETNELSAALSQAQGAFPEIERSRTVRVTLKGGGGYEFDYAPLDSIIGQVKGILAENGLSYRHSPVVEYGDGFTTVTQTCRLQHSSGQWAEATIALRTTESSPQAIGSALTYGRRYTLEHVLGIAAQTDDDGAGAAGNEATHAPRAARAPKPACPKCGKSEFVLEDREEKGKYFCWKNAEKGKLGCGHKWGGAQQQAPQPPEYDGTEFDRQEETTPPVPPPGNAPQKRGKKAETAAVETNPSRYAKAVEGISMIKTHEEAEQFGAAVDKAEKDGVFSKVHADGLRDMIVQKQKLLATEEQPAQ